MGGLEQQGPQKRNLDRVFKAGESDNQWMTDPETGQVMSEKDWEARRKERLEDQTHRRDELH
ncbi:MAG: hypothetical protein Q7S08_01995 [bacterium]|nr:hypothetical protein [bacterium]